MNAQTMLVCRTCGKPTLHLVGRTNHVLHLLLSVVTAGAWVVVWLLAGMSEKKAVCTACGTRYKRHLFESI